MEIETSLESLQDANAGQKGAGDAPIPTDVQDSPTEIEPALTPQPAIIASCSVRDTELHQSPLGAQAVTYNIQNIYGDHRDADRAGADEDPTFECNPPPLQGESLYSQALLLQLQQRLVEVRVLFLLFDSEGEGYFENVRDHLTNAMFAQSHAYRTTLPDKPLNFSLLRSRSSKFKYKKPSIICLRLGDIRFNAAFLDCHDLTSALAGWLVDANAYAIVPVRRWEVPRFDEHVRTPSRHVWPIKEALTARKDTVAIAADWDYDQPIANTVQFIIACFPGLPQNEFSTLVLKLLEAQQKQLDQLATEAERRARRSPANLMRRWVEDEDRIIAQCQAKYSRDAGSRGSYVFREADRVAAVREQVFTQARGWCARQFLVALELYLQAPSVSEALHQGMVDLTLLIHEHQLDTIDEEWLWTRWRSIPGDSTSPAAHSRFQSLFCSLLRSRQTRDAALAFLHGLVPEGKAAIQRWFETFGSIEAVRLYNPQLDAAGLATLEQHIDAQIDAMGPQELAPLRMLMSMQQLMVRALGVESAAIIVSILLESTCETPAEQQMAARFRASSRLSYATRPAAWSMFLALKDYLCSFPDLLAEYGDAVLAKLPKDKDAEDPAVFVLLDALHEATRQTLWANEKLSDDERRRFSAYFFDVTERANLPGILARSVAARNPQNDAMSLTEKSPERMNHMVSIATFYANLIDVLLRIGAVDGGKVRLRTHALMRPLRNSLNVRQRNDMRRMLRDSEEHHRHACAYITGANKRERLESARRFIEALCLMRATLP